MGEILRPSTLSRQREDNHKVPFHKVFIETNGYKQNSGSSYLETRTKNSSGNFKTSYLI